MTDEHEPYTRSSLWCRVGLLRLRWRIDTVRYLHEHKSIPEPLFDFGPQAGGCHHCCVQTHGFQSLSLHQLCKS